MTRIFLTFLCLLSLTSISEARKHHYQAVPVAAPTTVSFPSFFAPPPVAAPVVHVARVPIHHPKIHHFHHYDDGRPAAWCGWYMRHHVDFDPGPAYNRAREWIHWGQAATGPAPGVIGVLPHHVFKVTGILGKDLVMAISGNDSHTVRERPRSTRGVIAWRY